MDATQHDTGGQPAREMLIDRYLPDYDTTIVEHGVVDADVPTTWHAARELDFLRVRSPLLDAAMAARGLPERLARLVRREPPPAGPSSLRLAGEGGEMGLPGWLMLGEEPDRELAFGAVGRFWTPVISWRDVDREDFAGFDEPGYGKIAAAFSTRPYGTGRTLLSYEARTRALDAESRRRFLRYWRLVRPFVGHIMRATVGTIAADAAGRALASPAASR